MSLSALLGTAFLVALSGALMPGPLLTITITESARRGFKVVPLLMLGHAVLELLLVVALVAGLAAFLTQTTVSGIIGIIGGLFLVYLGWGMVKEVYRGQIYLYGSETEDAVPTPSNGMSPVLTGAVVSISNPYWSVWWATAGLTYLALALKQGTLGVAAFYSGHILADFGWYLLIGAAVAGGRKFINNSVYRSIIGICGVFLLGLGIYFVRYGLLMFV